MNNPNCCSIISSIVHLGETMKYSIVAEYVEEPKQRDRLKELGVSVYQGFLFSKAGPLSELLQWLHDRKVEAAKGEPRAGCPERR